MMQRTLEDNQRLLSQVKWLGTSVDSIAHSIHTIESVATIKGNTHTASPADTDGVEEIKSIPNIPTPRASLDARPSSRLSWSQNLIRLRPFEHVLASSSVYARARSQECDISFTSNQPKSALWSLLSGLSLSQISSISVIALPISMVDIVNGSWYKGNVGNVYTITSERKWSALEGISVETEIMISFSRPHTALQTLPSAPESGSIKEDLTHIALQPLPSTPESGSIEEDLTHIALQTLPSTPESRSIEEANIIETYTIAILGQSWVGKSTLAMRVSALDKYIFVSER